MYPIIKIIANGIANNAVGNTPRPIPTDWKYHVNKIVNIVPKDIMSPVAKLANLNIPYIKVTKIAPNANWDP